MKLLNNLSIKRKISFSFILFFTVLMICVIMVVRYLYITQTYSALKERRFFEDTLISEQMDKISKGANSCVNNIIISLSNILVPNSGKFEYPNIYDTGIRQKINTVIENSTIMFSDINQVTIVFNNGDLYRKDKKGAYSQSEQNSNLVRKLETMNITTLGEWYYSLEMDSPVSEYGLHYVKLLKDIEQINQVGYIIVEIDEQTLHSLYRNENSSSDVEFFLLDRNEMIISCDDRDLLDKIRAQKGYSQQLKVSNEKKERIKENYSSGDFLVNKTSIGNNWTFISVLNERTALSDVNSITINIIFVSVIVLVIFYALFLLVATRIAKPLTSLSKHMTKFKNTLPNKLEPSKSNDEIGVLINSFNQMVNMNEDLFKRISDEKRAKRELELALLQAQIKPHFLYNSLDTIFCLNGMGRYEQANLVTKSLAGYYRLVLNRGKEWVSLEQELEALKKYLDIQSVRYSDILTYDISVKGDLTSFQIPKLTLQPLIENSIYHGIKPKNDKGHISVTGEFKDNWVYIRVTDDGVGMSAETLNKILSRDKDFDNGESFGLKNVLDRVRLFYGPGSGIVLEENKDLTTVMLCLNLEKEEDE